MSRFTWFSLLLGVGLTFFSWVQAAAAEITGSSRAAQLEQCVEPTELMRKNHMEFLIHQRDQTVHRGLRTRKHSLVECVACHAEKTADGGFIAIDTEGQFCQSCHAALAVSMDCFQCHAAMPETSSTSMNPLSITTVDSYGVR